jgi:hypothetical protein
VRRNGGSFRMNIENKMLIVSFLLFVALVIVALYVTSIPNQTLKAEIATVQWAITFLASVTIGTAGFVKLLKRKL